MKYKIPIIVLSLVGYIALIVCIILFYIDFKKFDESMKVIDINASIAKQIAINLFFKKIESIGKISLTILGVLWAFVFFKGYRVSLSNVWQIILFSVPNLSLIGTFIFYIWGHAFLVGRLFYSATIDLKAPYVTLLCNGQLIFFIIGVIWFMLTVVFCHNNSVKENRVNTNE